MSESQSQQLTLSVCFQAKPSQSSLLRESLANLAKLSRLEEGCINFDLHESSEVEGQFLIYENWTSADLHKKHDESAHVLAWRQNARPVLVEQTQVSRWNFLKG